MKFLSKECHWLELSGRSIYASWTNSREGRIWHKVYFQPSVLLMICRQCRWCRQGSRPVAGSVTSAGQLASVISSGQAVSARVLKLPNLPFTAFVARPLPWNRHREYGKNDFLESDSGLKHDGGQQVLRADGARPDKLSSGETTRAAADGCGPYLCPWLRGQAAGVAFLRRRTWMLPKRPIAVKK